MKVTAGIVFLGLSVFLNSIELISSQPGHAESTSLAYLFPESNGIHFPHIEEVETRATHAFSNFETLNGHHMFHEALIYLKRGNVIFGYKDDGNIELLGAMFYEPLLAVFDIRSDKWYILTFSEIKKLGVGRNLKLVQAHDEAHALLHNLHHQTNPDAHNSASEFAYQVTMKHESVELYLHKQGVKSLEECAQSVKDVYERAYAQAFGRYQLHVAGLSRGG